MKMTAISQMPHNLANSAVSWSVDRKYRQPKKLSQTYTFCRSEVISILMVLKQFFRENKCEKIFFYQILHAKSACSLISG